MPGILNKRTGAYIRGNTVSYGNQNNWNHEAQDELGALLVPVSSSFTQTDINKLPNKKQAQGRKERVPFYQNKKILL